MYTNLLVAKIRVDSWINELWIWCRIFKHKRRPAWVAFYLFSVCHCLLEIDQCRDWCRVNPVSHCQIVGHVITEQNRRPHVGKWSISACFDEIGVQAFEHKCLAS